MTNLVIANHTISQYNGFYSLNDLHRASGAEKKHQPALFFRNAEVQDLILEIERSTNLQNGEKSIAYHTIQGGNSKTTKQGTYACRELVYRYAMWISPKFSLMVIRAFDALNTGAIPCLAKTTPADRRLSATQIAQIRAAVKQVTSTGAVSYQYLYHAINTEFGGNVRYLKAEQFDDVIKFICGFSVITTTHSETADYNAFWRTVGLLEHDRIKEEIHDLQKLVDVVSHRLLKLSKGTGLLFDALNEQTTGSRMPAKQRYEQARAFLDKQRCLD